MNGVSRTIRIDTIFCDCIYRHPYNIIEYYQYNNTLAHDNQYNIPRILLSQISIYQAFGSYYLKMSQANEAFGIMD